MNGSRWISIFILITITISKWSNSHDPQLIDAMSNKIQMFL
jgi:hypothetical protein